MSTISALGSTAPFADWRSSLVSPSSKAHNSPHGHYYPGALAGMDLHTPIAHVTRGLIEDCEAVYAWLDARTANDTTTYRDVAFARWMGTPVVLGIDSTYDGESGPLESLATIVRRADSPLAAFQDAMPELIDILLPDMDPSPPEKAFWKAHREAAHPCLEGLVPEFEIRFPGESGRPIVRRFDFALPSKKLLIEVDGAGHDDDIADRNDRLKTELAERFGWSVMRFRSKPLMADPASKVSEVAERASRTPNRSDKSLKTRVMPTRAMDGYAFGTARIGGKVVPQTAPTDGTDIIIGMLPDRFVAPMERIESQRSALRSLLESMSCLDDMDDIFTWLDNAPIGATREVVGSENRRVIITSSLWCDEGILHDPQSEPGDVESVVINIDASKSWDQQCSSPLWAALRHVCDITMDDVLSLYGSAEGTMTVPVRTNSGPARVVSLRSNGHFDEDAAWEVARWWDVTLTERIKEFTLRVKPGAKSLKAALGADMYFRFPHIAKVNRWYLGEPDGDSLVWTTERPLIRVQFEFADETDRELANMLAYPEIYHP